MGLWGVYFSNILYVFGPSTYLAIRCVGTETLSCNRPILPNRNLNRSPVTVFIVERLLHLKLIYLYQKQFLCFYQTTTKKESFLGHVKQYKYMISLILNF